MLLIHDPFFFFSSKCFLDLLSLLLIIFWLVSSRTKYKMFKKMLENIELEFWFVVMSIMKNLTWFWLCDMLKENLESSEI